MRLLAKAPDARYATVAGLVDALRPPSPVASVAPATPRAAPDAVRPMLDFDWVVIRAGAFTMGSTLKQAKQVFAAYQKATGKGEEYWFTCEAPQHQVYVPAFRMARVPVTVAQFQAFVVATSYQTTAEKEGKARGWDGQKYDWIAGADWRHPRGAESGVQEKLHHPVTCVSWHDAVAFCAWAGVRLPSEAQWERAARGLDARSYPWGNEAPDVTRCNYNWNVKDTTAVGQYPKGASAEGLLDMAGNVLEWTSTRWGGTDWAKPGFAYPYTADDGREEQKIDDSRVLRGGAFNYNEYLVRCASRLRYVPGNRYFDIGFRVMSPGF